MIINIPLQIDEQKMEEVIARDYEGKVLEKITEYVKKTLMDNSTESYYTDTDRKISSGMANLIEGRIDVFLADHKDEIIEDAAKALAEKLARSKKGKAILDGLEVK